jgi:hypothetical protein
MILGSFLKKKKVIQIIDINIDCPLSTSLRRTVPTYPSLFKMSVDLSKIEAHLTTRSYVEG